MNFRTSMILVLLLFFMCSCAQMFQNGQFSQDGTYLQSDDPQLDSEDDPLVAAEGSPADDSPSSIENATEENGLDSEIVGSVEEDPNGDKNSAGIAYPAKKAQPVLDDALEALNKNDVPQREKEEVLYILYSMKNDIVRV